MRDVALCLGRPGSPWRALLPALRAEALSRDVRLIERSSAASPHLHGPAGEVRLGGVPPEKGLWVGLDPAACAGLAAESLASRPTLVVMGDGLIEAVREVRHGAMAVRECDPLVLRAIPRPAGIVVSEEGAEGLLARIPRSGLDCPIDLAVAVAGLPPADACGCEAPWREVAQAALDAALDGAPCDGIAPSGWRTRRTAVEVDSFLRTVLDLIAYGANDKHFDVSEMSDRLGFSRRTVEARLRALGAPPPALLIRRARADLAARMVDRRMTVREIAIRSGFGTEAAFRAAFHERWGVSPGRFPEIGRRLPV